MGGAERNERKRRQEQRSGGGKGGQARGPAQRSSGAKAVAAARGSGGADRTRLILGVVAVVVVAAAVIGGVLWTNSKKNATQDSAIPVAQVANDLPNTRDGATVLVGKDTAGVTIDIYEDFLCPICGQFEQTNSAALEQKLEAGTIKVRYHLVNLLNERSDPAGYSTDAANAALLAADEGKFVQFHKSLYDTQPTEGGRGWDKQQLIDLGKAMGLTSQAFADGITAGKYDSAVTAEYDKARTTDALLQEAGDGQKAFGTPTVAVNGRPVSTAQANWIDQVVANAG
ncbi:DsbA family protein [Actinokineospora bangkokensis]|uniref:Thioredoxin-like fold domain-containing protein n=1 Tax=Actinokineospora bangkokensis TaxID=1193682 RepID=A0A1Q9LC99_9PSEU|nr:thioredoxin domain-containing protein [Actinokineospora bangkokensis]OLR89657.1 hypothetical protein BJP25_04685 [Actinokineospora bangkokensis]